MTGPTRVRWMVFVLGCGASWFLYLHRYALSLFKDDIQDAFHLTGGQLGLLDATFRTCYFAFQVPLGVLVDALGVHLLLSAMIIVWSAALATQAWAPTTAVLWWGRGLVGAAQAGVFSALSTVTKRWFPSSIRTTVQGWIGVFWARFGGFFGYLFLGTVLVGAVALGWRTAIYGVAAAGVVHGLLFLLLYRNSPARHPWTNHAEQELIEGGAAAGASDRMSFRQVLSRMSGRSILNLGMLCLAAMFSAVADLVYSDWIPLFLKRVHGLNKVQMGFFAALPLAGGALGGVIGGMLNDRLIRRTGALRWIRSLSAFAGKGIAALLLGLALFFYANPYVFCIILVAVKFFADIELATRWGTVTDIGGPVTATIFATVNAVGIAGTVAGSAAVGFLIPQKATQMADAAGWRPMFLIAIGMYVACACAWLLVKSTVPVLSERGRNEDGRTS